MKIHCNIEDKIIIKEFSEVTGVGVQGNMFIIRGISGIKAMVNINNLILFENE